MGTSTATTTQAGLIVGDADDETSTEEVVATTKKPAATEAPLHQGGNRTEGEGTTTQPPKGENVTQVRLTQKSTITITMTLQKASSGGDSTLLLRQLDEAADAMQAFVCLTIDLRTWIPVGASLIEGCAADETCSVAHNDVVLTGAQCEWDATNGRFKVTASVRRLVESRMLSVGGITYSAKAVLTKTIMAYKDTTGAFVSRTGGPPAAAPVFSAAPTAASLQTATAAKLVEVETALSAGDATQILAALTALSGISGTLKVTALKEAITEQKATDITATVAVEEKSEVVITEAPAVTEAPVEATASPVEATAAPDASTAAPVETPASTATDAPAATDPPAETATTDSATRGGVVTGLLMGLVSAV